jgi:hypothetical protein
MRASDRNPCEDVYWDVHPHYFVPVGQPTEWRIPMDDDAWAVLDPTAPSENAPYTTNSQNRGGFC